MTHRILIALAIAGCAPIAPLSPFDFPADASANAPMADARVVADRADAPRAEVLAVDVPRADVVVLDDGVVWITDAPDAPDVADAGTATDTPAVDAGGPVAVDAGTTTPDVPSVDVGTPCTGILMACDGACVNVLSDPRHCGDCGVVCPGAAHGAPVCRGGACAVTCEAGRASCGGEACATDLASDHDHCGACGRGCTGSQECRGWQCVGCPAGESACGGRCVNLTTDNANCGGCGVACTGSRVCSLGSCVYVTCGPAAGDVMCSGRCMNIYTDRANCGSCGRVCGAGRVCAFGDCIAG